MAGADVILLLQNGVPIFAHKRYLERNSYFVAHFQFIASSGSESESAASSSPIVLKVLPPFPFDMHLVLCHIYENPEKGSESESRLNPSNFIPTFMNARFLQADVLVDGCVEWFPLHWKAVIQDPSFHHSLVDSDALELLLEQVSKKLNNGVSSADIFNILLRWSRDWESSEIKSDFNLKQLVSKYVNFADVTTEEWGAFAEEFVGNIASCVDLKSVVSVLKTHIGSVYEI
ncbi:hypothetical protein HDU99_007872, partial [Rhizoclosmatium hyalinum]